MSQVASPKINEPPILHESSQNVKGMVIRRVNNNTYDIFMSPEFWSDWTRVRVTRDGIYGIAGRRLPRSVLRQIEEAVK